MNGSFEGTQTTRSIVKQLIFSNEDYYFDEYEDMFDNGTPEAP